jgi:outer membrane receptor protein involved in Fe transport
MANRFVRRLMALMALASPPAVAQEKSSDLTIDIEVEAKRLDAARLTIQPYLGASSYGFAPDSLAAIPQGSNARLDQVLLRAPGVAQDSFAQLHVRGDHANLQYRLDGVALPEGLSLFGQFLEGRFARSLTLITGALPAQYGFRTAGIIDIQTKSGLSDPGLELSMYGGMQGWLQPSFAYGGHQGAVDWFVTGDYLRNNVGIENPTGSINAIHDRTDQLHGLAHISAILDPATRISLIMGAFDGQFQIPNNPGQPTLGFPVNGQSSFNSAALNQNQREASEFVILSLQKHVDLADLQISAYMRRSTLNYSPDWTGELLFNGIAQRASRSSIAYGLQADGSYRLNEQHTIRYGMTAQQEHVSANTFSQVLPVDAFGDPTTDQPVGIGTSSAKVGGRYGVYIQDEWRILSAVTINAGLRLDTVDEFTHESQLSPRLNIVWKPTESTTIHAGYARYFTPPPFELLSAAAVAPFAGTTGAPPGSGTTTPRAERAHYFDLGINQIVVPGLTLGLDAYYKKAANLLDEGQFGAPIILTPFNYESGYAEGIELSASYERGPWSAYGNLAWSKAMGRNIVSSQFNFDPAELAYIANNYVHLDHDQTWTGSMGLAWTMNGETDHPTRVSGDLIVQSGLRATPDGGAPNSASLPAHAVLNLSIVQKFATRTELRLDALNVNDAVYQIRDGSGVGVGAPQFGLRRTVLVGVTQRF